MKILPLEKGVNAKEDWFLTRVTAPISALKIF
jgi:hypothetical protein